MIVLLDQDGVLADFERGLIRAWREKFPGRPFVPIRNRTTFYAEEDYPAEYCQDVRNIYLTEGFFEHLPVVEGAQQAVSEMVDMGLDVLICTSPITRSEFCAPEKLRWVARHFGSGFTRDLTRHTIILKDKTLVRGDVLIDDRPVISGRMEPAWEHLVFEAPYNSRSPSRRINWQNWRTVLGV